MSKSVDALSVSLERPIIVRNEAKESPGRQRFDIGHELGHAVMHTGKVTGDRSTESEANRFAGALLVPKSMMLKFFPKPRGAYLDWKSIGDFKLTWGISKAASLYRAWQLQLLSDQQYRSGVIHLKRTGEAIREREDHLMVMERPELLETSLEFLRTKRGISIAAVAEALQVNAALLSQFTGFTGPNHGGTANNVVPLLRRQA